MKQKVRVYVSDGQVNYIDGLPKVWDVVVTDTFKDADLVLFTGGEDVCPLLYRHPQHYTTRFSQFRDDTDLQMFYKAKSMALPMLGVCRGFQFLSVMCGSTLIQDSNQFSLHEVMCDDGVVRNTNSAHHQIVTLDSLDKSNAARVMARASGNYVVKEYNEDIHSFVTRGGAGDIEMASWVHDGNDFFGIQGHPEWGSMPKDFLEYFHEQLDLWLFESGLI